MKIDALTWSGKSWFATMHGGCANCGPNAKIVEQLLYPAAPPAEASATELATDAEAEQTPPNTSLHAEQTATPFEENAAVCSARRPARCAEASWAVGARSTRNQYSVVK